MIRNFLIRIFRLRPEELGLVLSLGFVLFGNAMARQVAGIVSITGFLDSGGVNQFLLVLAIDYFFILVIGGLQSLIVDKFNRYKMLANMTLGFAGVFLLLRLMFVINAPERLIYIIMYIVAEQQWLIYPLIFWVLANEVFNMSQSKRVFPLISSWSFVGKLLGIGLAAVSPTILTAMNVGDENILLVNVAIYLIIYAVLWWQIRGVPLRVINQKPESVKETLTDGWDFVRDVPAFRYLAIVILLMAIIDTTIEFRFLGTTADYFTTRASYQQFYSLYRLTATLAAFGLQSFVTTHLIEKLGLKNSFLILPIVMLVGVAAMLLWPSIFTAVGAMFFLKLMRETVDDSSRKSFQSLVPSNRRGRVSTFLETYLTGVGTIVGCIVVGGIVWGGLLLGQADQTYYVYLGLVGVLAAVAIWSANRLRHVYEESLLNWRLKGRSGRGMTEIMKKLDF